MNAIDRKRQYIRLNHSHGQVLVEPEDEDRFVMAAQSAVKACQEGHQREKAIHVFKHQFLTPLILWCQEHHEQVRACYLPAAPGGVIQVFVVGTSEKYDFALGRQLAELELRLAGSGWKVSVIQLPMSDDLQTYFNAEGAIEVYAQLQAAQG